MEVSAAERADFRRSAGPLLVEVAKQVGEIRDPGTRELVAASLMPDELMDGPDEYLFEAMDIVAETEAGPELVAAMAVSAPTAVAVRARTRLEELASPPAGPGRLEVVEAHVMEDDESIAALFLLCKRDRARGAQLFSFTIDDLLGGAVKDGFATGTSEGRRFLKRLPGTLPEEVELRPLPPEEAAARVLAAAEAAARQGLRPQDDEAFAALTVFLRASGLEEADALVQLLELGRPPGQLGDDDFPPDTMALAENFATEAYGWLRGRGYDAERAEEGRFAAGLMADFQLVYRDAVPHDWDADVLDEFLLDWVPRKLILSDEDRELLVPAVADVLEFLGGMDCLSAKDAAALAKRARGHEQLVLERMDDPSARGPSAVLIDAMLGDGVELTDPAAVQAWLTAFNARSFEDRDNLIGPVLPSAPPPSPPPSSPGKRAKARKAERQARRRNR